MGNRYIDAFRGTGVDDEILDRGADLSYFQNLPNAATARDALDLVLNPAAIAQLGKMHSEQEIAQLKRAVFRACITFGVPLPSRAVVQARMLGVIVPT